MVESVCSVDRLAEVCKDNQFSSIPVVNMAGKIIGLIPKNFIIVLIENHHWYLDSTDDEKKIDDVTSMYKTAVVRQDSRALSSNDFIENQTVSLIQRGSNDSRENSNKVSVEEEEITTDKNPVNE